MNPIGLFIQPRHINKDDLIKHVSKAQYVTCSVLDDLSLTATIGCKYPVYREWAFEPQPVQFQANHIINWIKGKGVPNIYYMINCEQNVTSERFDMYADLAIALQREANTNGIVPFGIVVGNFASGSIRCGQSADPNDWILKAENFLKVFADLSNLKLPNGQPALILGLHEYTSQFAWKVADGGVYYDQPAAWPNQLNWSLPQWHLGRNIQGLEKAYTHFKIDHRIPIIITEGIIDDMQDVPGGYRHYKSLTSKWNSWYRPDNIHTVLAKQAIWIWEKVYKPWPYVLGMHIFTYCDPTNEWSGFAVNF